MEQTYGTYTAPPTYETLKALWLGKAPTCGPSERYDREVNFEAWAAQHGIVPEPTCDATSWPYTVDDAPCVLPPHPSTNKHRTADGREW